MMSSFEEKPYWRPHYADDISTLLPTIKKYNKAIRKFAADPVNGEDLQAFMDYHRQEFINEYNRRPKFFAAEVEDDIAYKTRIQHRNLKDAIEYVFGDTLFSDKLRVNFDSKLPKTLHSLIGKELFPDTGIYRSSNTNPKGYKFLYLHPNDIPNWLENVFADINTPIGLGVEDWYDKATEFFDRFLYAHPFVNGNGRVARFLVSALLIHHTIVPVCLFSWKPDSNPIYLHVLQEAHEFGNNRLLKSFIIEAVHGNLEKCVQMLDVPV